MLMEEGNIFNSNSELQKYLFWSSVIRYPCRQAARWDVGEAVGLKI